MKEPIVTFVAIAWKEVWEPYMFIGMLKCMKSSRWKAIIWHDDINPEMRAIVEHFNDDRITYMETPNRGSWGAYNRIDALKMVDTEFCIQTTVQEYYCPITVDMIEEFQKNDLIYWPCLHHQFQYNVLDPAPVRTKMDWSNFALRTHIARKVGINYPTAFIGDGLFIEDVMRSNLVKKSIKIPKILNIKN